MSMRGVKVLPDSACSPLGERPWLRSDHILREGDPIRHAGSVIRHSAEEDPEEDHGYSRLRLIRSTSSVCRSIELVVSGRWYEA